MGSSNGLAAGCLRRLCCRGDGQGPVQGAEHCNEQHCAGWAREPKGSSSMQATFRGAGWQPVAANQHRVYHTTDRPLQEAHWQVGRMARPDCMGRSGLEMVDVT